MKIINSARFLKMPSSSQLLYFHLGLNADDDGVVEGYNILRMTGCSEDDLRVLVAKNFIIVLNEDLVSFVTDWNEHNLIRPDRKIDSIYKDLLLQIVPGVEMVTKTQRSDVKKLIGQSMDGEWTADGQTKAGIGKVSLGEDKIVKDKTEIGENIPYKEIVDYLNLKTNKKFGSSGKATKDLIKARYNDKFTLEDFKTVIDIKSTEWNHIPLPNQSDMRLYLRPQTLFSNKFEGYLNQVGDTTSKEPKKLNTFGAAY